MGRALLIAVVMTGVAHAQIAGAPRVIGREVPRTYRPQPTPVVEWKTPGKWRQEQRDYVELSSLEVIQKRQLLRLFERSNQQRETAIQHAQRERFQIQAKITPGALQASQLELVRESRRLSSLIASLKRANEPFLPSGPGPELDDIGRCGVFCVDQRVPAGALGHFEGQERQWLVRACGEDRAADGDSIDLSHYTLCTSDTYSYVTVLGAPRTVKVLQPADPVVLEAFHHFFATQKP